jgi:hypothetical protein
MGICTNRDSGGAVDSTGGEGLLPVSHLPVLQFPMLQFPMLLAAIANANA